MPRRGLLALALAVGCAAPRPPAAPAGGVDSTPPAAFRFPEDAFSFANETVWAYAVDAVTREVSPHAVPSPPSFSWRCGAMTRAARQFHLAARFDPAAPRADDRAYGRLVRAVLDTDPRRPPPARITIPGYRDLREFSAAHEALLKDALGGPWPSYFQRGNWRMIFPFSPGHQREQAAEILRELARGWPPILHVLVFPERTINHLVLVYGAEETPAEIRFRAYDPNDASRPIELTYDRAARTFVYPADHTFAGGPVKAYEVYAGWLY